MSDEDLHHSSLVRDPNPGKIPDDVTVDAWREDKARKVLTDDGTPYAETYVTKLREAGVFDSVSLAGAIDILNQFVDNEMNP